MHRIWQLFDPRRVLIALFAFLTALGFRGAEWAVPLAVLMSPDTNWLPSKAIEAPASSMTAMPPARTMN
ncbi:MAG: light-harvesting antenna LH1, alpha subunit [Halochromatium sp.]